MNLDSETVERTQLALEKPSRFTLDAAQQHVFTLMKKDTYPRFVRSDHYRQLLVKASLLQQAQVQRKRYACTVFELQSPFTCWR